MKKFYSKEEVRMGKLKPEIELPLELKQKQRTQKKENRRKENGIKRFNEKCNR